MDSSPGLWLARGVPLRTHRLRATADGQQPPPMNWRSRAMARAHRLGAGVVEVKCSILALA